MGACVDKSLFCPDHDSLDTPPRGDSQAKAGSWQSLFNNNSELQPETLLDAFAKCDPQGTGYITDKNRFAALARTLAGSQESADTLWSKLDQDGNGAVSFPEFVEWAQLSHILLPVGLKAHESGIENHDSEAALGPGGLPLPHGWKGPKDDKEWNERLWVDDREIMAELQHLVTVTYKKVWTRDRKATGRNEVPMSYTVTKALHSENYIDWQRYYVKRHQLVHHCNDVTNDANGATWFQPMPALTAQAYSLQQRHRLRTTSCNEWLLFHGTNPDAIEAICGGDFTLHKAGSATGTLYGRGTYFAESITKADEYASPDKNGDCCVLLCRVVGGRVLYNDEVTPDADKLQNTVLSGNAHSILGDREKCRKTFKEYVLFDADQVYVEYALFYKRQYAQKA